MPGHETRHDAGEKFVNTCLRLDGETRDWFRDYAKSQDRTMSAELRRLIEQKRAEVERNGVPA